jgi:hypothetical protein
MAANITYLGEPGAGEDTVLHWAALDFPINTPVLVDPDVVATNGERIFYEHVLKKAAKNQYFTYEEVTPAARKTKAKAKDEEPDAEDKNGDDDFADDYFELPKDWRDLHHKRLIALARRMGGEGDDLATRDGAIAFIDEYLRLGGRTSIAKRGEA